MSGADTLLCYEIYPSANPLIQSPDVIHMKNGQIILDQLPVLKRFLHIILEDNTTFYIDLSTSSGYVHVFDDPQKKRNLWPFMEHECYDIDVIEHVKCAQERKHKRQISHNEALLFYDLMYYRMKTNHMSLLLNPAFLDARRRYEFCMDAAISKVSEAAIAREKWVNRILDDFWIMYEQR